MQDLKMIQRHLIATILFSVILRANAFSYKDAKNWGKKYPECNGKHQSPVILNPPNLIDFPNINKMLKFTNFNKLPTNMTIQNTGHTVELKAHWSGIPPTLSGGPLRKNYVFEKMTFHWAQKPFTLGDGHNDDPYSDHRPYTLDMEVNIFFYRTDLKSFEEAQSQKGGLAAFQMWLKTGYAISEHLFDIVEKNVHKVHSPNSSAVIPPIRLASMLGDTVPPFDFYEGSLPYPPCSESVTWFVYGVDYAVTDKLVNEFRKVKLSEGDVSNLRPPQPLNNRQPKSVNSYNGKDE